MTSSDLQLVELVRTKLIISRIHRSLIHPTVIVLDSIADITVTWFLVDNYLCYVSKRSHKVYIFDQRYSKYLKLIFYVSVDVFLLFSLCLPMFLNSWLGLVCVVGMLIALLVSCFISYIIINIDKNRGL